MIYLQVEKNISLNTVEAYNKDLLQFFQFLLQQLADKESEYLVNVDVIDEDIVTASIRRDDIRSFVEYLHDKGLANSSIERKIASLKSFFKFLFNKDIIKNNPAHSVIFPRKGHRIPHFLYNDQIDKILDFTLQKFADYRDRALLEVFYSTGARVSEIATAKLIDLQLSKNSLLVMGKGGMQRLVFLTASAVSGMQQYLAWREKKFGPLKGELFVNSRGAAITVRGIFYIIKKRARAAGFTDYVSPHTFRHSFATEMLNNGADIRSVQEMLGHRDLAATQIYTHTTRKRLQKIYEKYHPHAGGSDDENKN